MCEKTVEKDSWLLRYIPDQYKTQEMCNKAVDIDPYQLEHVPGHLRIEEMCKGVLCFCPWLVGHVPDQYKTQKMCNKAVKVDPSFLRFVSDWFVTQEQLKLWHDIDYWLIRWYNNRFIKWYDGYKKRKAEKTKIKEELLSIAWHPSRWWNWCIPEDEKQGTEKLWE